MLSLLLAPSAFAAPETTIDSDPIGLTNNTTPTWTFESDDPSGTFECQMDNAGFAACPDGDSYTADPLTDGIHTFEVRAVDAVPDPDPTPASESFTVDTTPPNTSIDSGPSGLTTDTTPTFGFSSNDAGASFECRVDADAFAACSGPGDTHTTAALADGPHTFEVRAVDAADNPDPTPASRSFTVDTTPPNTSIDSGPSGLTTDTTPTFGFSSDDAGASFECRVDADAFAACSGPGDTHTTAALADGPHTFEVRAVDAADNPDPTPASRSFTVDTTPPNTSIDSGPSGLTTDTTPTFGFSSGDAGASFECRVDADAFAACSGPGDTHTTAALADGPHTFEVRAVDAADNPDPTPASRSFTVDTTPPNTSIDSGPSGLTTDTTPTFGFSSDDAGASFECRVDADAFAACSGPGDTHTTAALADGPHTFEVRAVDAADNPDPTPASRSFTVDSDGPPDTTAPDTTIAKRPKGRIKTDKRKVAVRVSFRSEKGADFQCRLDQTKYSPCRSPYRVKAKAKGGKGKQHTISVRAIDGAGNIGKPAVVKFRVLRNPQLRAPVAKRTVLEALKSHGFAHRVVKAVEVDCRRRSRSAFACRFSAGFPGYRLQGTGKVKLGDHLRYRFRVVAQGARFNLTDKNEKPRSG